MNFVNSNRLTGRIALGILMTSFGTGLFVSTPADAAEECAKLAVANFIMTNAKPVRPNLSGSAGAAIATSNQITGVKFDLEIIVKNTSRTQHYTYTPDSFASVSWKTESSQGFIGSFSPSSHLPRNGVERFRVRNIYIPKNNGTPGLHLDLKGFGMNFHCGMQTQGNITETKFRYVLHTVFNGGQPKILSRRIAAPPSGPIPQRRNGSALPPVRG